MKTKNLLLSLSIVLVLVLSLSSIFANEIVNYSVYYGIVEDNAAMNATNIPMNGVNAEVYTCLNAACSLAGNTLVTTASSNSTSNVLSISFPTILQSQYGYVIHVTKAGYIGWEQRGVIRYGDNLNSNSATPFYISQKRNGYSPIMNLAVTETVPTGMPIRVGFNVSVDADTYSALTANTVSNIPLNYVVQTNVTVEITNASGNVVYTTNQMINVPVSGFLPVSFDCPAFADVGTYSVRVYTDIPSSETKILNSIRQSATSTLFIIPQNLRNYTFTLINNLQMSPAPARENDNINFSFTYLSGFVDAAGALFPANTNLNMTFYNGVTQISNSFVGVGSSGTYSFIRNFTDSGNYRLVVIGTPNDARGNFTISSTQELVFTIGDAINNTIIIPPVNPPHNHEVKGEDYTKDKFTPSYPLNSGTNETIVLSAPAKSIWCWNLLIWVLAIGIIFLLIGIGVIYYLKF